jgi:hypothetical protein
MMIGGPANRTEQKPRLLQPKLAKVQSLLTFIELDQLHLNEFRN